MLEIMLERSVDVFNDFNCSQNSKITSKFAPFLSFSVKSIDIVKIRGVV